MFSCYLSKPINGLADTQREGNKFTPELHVCPGLDKWQAPGQPCAGEQSTGLGPGRDEGPRGAAAACSSTRAERRAPPARWCTSSFAGASVWVA